MKAIVKFDLTDPDDRLDHKQWAKASDMACVLWEFAHNSKKSIEWEMDGKEINKYEALDMVFEKFWDLMNEHSINIDEIMN